MSFPTEQQKWMTLGDWGGVWCAACMRYIPDESEYDAVDFGERLEMHHVLAQASISPKAKTRVVSEGVYPLTWVVPAHKDCHVTELQTLLNPLSAKLKLFLKLPVHSRDDAIKRLHDEGNYFLAGILNIETAMQHKRAEDSESYVTRIARGIQSWAGVKLGRTPKFLSEPLKEFPDDSTLLLAESNLLSNMRRHNEAERILARALQIQGSLSSATRERYRLQTAIRTLQIERSERAAKRALEIAKSDSYSQNTARVLSMDAYFADKPSRSHDLCYEVLDGSDSASWLYVAEAWYGIARHRFRESKKVTKEIYELLVKSQFVFIMFGYQGISLQQVLPVEEDSQGANLPGEFLRRLPKPNKWSKEKLTEMRVESIVQSGLCDDVISTLNYVPKVLSTRVKTRNE